MAGNQSLNARKGSPRDEHYTQIADIEKEVRHYKPQFHDKVVLCNTDDAYESHFFQYFAMNFEHLGLRKLIGVSYEGSPFTGTVLPLSEIAGLRDHHRTTAFKIEITQVPDSEDRGSVGLPEVLHLLRHDPTVVTPLVGNGDFRSPEGRALIEEADIVVTNPPWSLFAEFVDLLVLSGKRFLFMGPLMATTLDSGFEHVAEKRLWFGHKQGGNTWFRVPPHYHRPDNQRDKIVDGETWQSNGGTFWFTNLTVTKPKDKVTLYKHYSPTEYRTFLNYDAIEVKKVSDIPMDYDGAMAVPINFLARYNTDQFEVLGTSSHVEKNDFPAPTDDRFYYYNDKGKLKKKFPCLLIRRKES